MFQRVAIIGLGLIGGSLGLALHKAHASCEVVGYDARPGVGKLACQDGAIDRFYHKLADLVATADLVVLATPVGAMQKLLQEIAPFLKPGAVVTDVASTKVEVIHWAETYLPSTVSFIGGHPMAGKEVSGIEAADPDLFRGRIYCLTPTEQTSVHTITTVSALVEMLGACLRILEPSSHDAQVASVSHLPFLASVALMLTSTDATNWSDAAVLASSGFRDSTRLAAGSPEMYRDICLTNSSAIIESLDACIARLASLRKQISDHDPSLSDTFVRAQQSRQQWQETSKAER